MSKLFYFGSAILFFGYLFRIYFSEKIKLKPETMVTLAFAIFMLIVIRGAQRTLFLSTPIICLFAAYFVVNIFVYFRKTDDDLVKMFLGILFLIVVVLSIMSVNSFMVNSKAQSAGSKQPIGGTQWQSAMAWTRNNTPIGSIFVHWWDYGYMVQYMGQRPTLADGGHFEGAFRDHMIGRYLLTTPKPETALSFLKSNNVSYLLIDPSDIGKYTAYSSIGSDNSGDDRTSYMPTMVMDPSQTQETNNSEIRFYQNGVYVDKDIVYNQSGKEIFLPQGQAIVAGFILEIKKGKDNAVSFEQPKAVFVYNNQQISIPLRYLYDGKNMIDYKNGLEAGVDMIPYGSFNGQNIQISQFGAGIYLSEKTFNSLVAQLYLMNDPFGKYKTIIVAHSEQDPLVQSLRSQGMQVGDFVFANGLRGPLEIWDTRNIPENILYKEEFLRNTGTYAEFDNLSFTK